jgi:septin family protein
MKELSNVANLIPIISKKESPSKNEAIDIKTKLLEEGRSKYNINFLELDVALNVSYKINTNFF